MSTALPHPLADLSLPVSSPSSRALSIDAFTAFHEAHVEFVWRAARRLGAPPGALDDVVQEVFLRAFRKEVWAEADALPRAWLYRAAHNVVRELRRGARRSEATDALDDTASPARDPERAAVAQEDLALFERLLAAVAPERREVFLLAEWMEMSAPEIAAALELNVNTVYSRLRLAREDFNAAVARHTRSAR